MMTRSPVKTRRQIAPPSQGTAPPVTPPPVQTPLRDPSPPRNVTVLPVRPCASSSPSEHLSPLILSQDDSPSPPPPLVLDDEDELDFPLEELNTTTCKKNRNLSIIVERAKEIIKALSTEKTSAVKVVTKQKKAQIRMAACEIIRLAEATDNKIGIGSDQPLQTITQESPTPETSFQNPAIADIRSTIKECIKQEIAAIREEIIKNPVSSVPAVPTLTPNSVTYAKVAATPNKALNRKAAKPAIIVTKKGTPAKNAHEMNEAFHKAISFKTVRYAPVKIQPVAANKLRIEFDSDDQCAETLQRLQTNDNLMGEPVKKLRPMVVLKGISKITQKEELVPLIIQQNPTIQAKIINESDIQLKFTKANKNNKLYNAVLLVTPRIWREMTNLERISVNYQKVSVADHCPLLQCFSCLRFGHVRSRCTANEKLCSHCSGSGHTYTDCPHQKNNNVVNCYNCCEFNHQQKTTSDTKHSATSFYCPQVQKMMERTSSRVDYGY